jgi:hypothetical protein
VSQWWEACCLSGSTPDCCPAVPGSNLVSPQPTADCESPGGLPPGMGLGCEQTSVRGNRGENYENEQLDHQKHIKKKKRIKGCLKKITKKLTRSLKCSVVDPDRFGPDPVKNRSGFI